MKEFLIDTNIFVRLLTKEPIHQYEEAREIFRHIEEEKKSGIVSILVVNEVLWILERFYKMKRSVSIPELLHLLLLKNIKIIEVSKDILVKILQKMILRKIDFTDIYLAEIARSRKIISFDRDFEKLN